ncbi:SDR family NAD(P)-dependent oxidoreductase [Nocardioides jishulii]|uniref:SDR family NAD(P)-dependent oxidoreductase n=1 Tax=Nocardioides jishulii TaxID=2575440 RepID=A0A4U2YSB4_9ACTN|nr:SDR family NAD(P)-dependent oxidoreductase [Nocardioides jishulii]QCX28747.1 SDR family NAD(P)-dependent oxidoreductase [Nocardioides jishulii]TKI64357.1 SDR family NAD(P)-dependent oxidoreductase [Nocardioides jishulii]
MEINGKVIVVTGGGNGIGREVVLELLRRGARVAAVDLRAAALAETAALAGAGDRLTSHEVDVSDAAAVERMANEVLAAHGTVDGLANVAGIIQKFVPFKDLDLDTMQKVVDVNLWGVVHTCRAFLPHLVQRPEASLVNVSSMGALVPVPGQSLYGASKAAVKLLTEGLYAELRTTSVAVTVVFPGAVSTGIADNSDAAVPGRDASNSDAAAKLTSAPDAGRMIVEAMEKGQPRLRIGSDATMLDRLSRLAPTRAIELVAKRMAGLVS